MRRRHRQHRQRGFILLGVILVISVIVASVMLTLRTSSETLRQAAGVRSRELVSQALTHGLNAAMVELEGVDERREGPATSGGESEGVIV